ncbi:hypothetical protein OsJ_36501 [Oryza sativa Japonica Group]|uniref:Disease resistance N-terminal domain-containing protein n=1 Tax=Oryza sativa subsp. japonica TaxID=39947 RepID=B9GDR9_ORYSJ|nr:hypothetical protein OsJ_36501 [Oryza sativa Japonica Group]
MEATAVSIGRSVLKGALGFAKSTLVEEVSLQLGVQRDQAFIRDELEMMNSFLMAANDEKDDNKVVRNLGKAGPRRGLQRRGLPPGLGRPLGEEEFILVAQPSHAVGAAPHRQADEGAEGQG